MVEDYGSSIYQYLFFNKVVGQLMHVACKHGHRDSNSLLISLVFISYLFPPRKPSAFLLSYDKKNHLLGDVICVAPKTSKWQCINPSLSEKTLKTQSITILPILDSGPHGLSWMS